MITTVITAIITFVSTNIDDIFILMLFFTEVKEGLKTKHIITGQFLGIGILVVISIIVSRGMLFLPKGYLNLLGIIPIYIGVKGLINRNKEEEVKKSKKDGILKVASITIANGGDNLGIYIPLFSSMNKEALLITMIIFTLLTGLWCYIGFKLSKNSFIEEKLEKYKSVAVPIVFICIGLYILI